MTKVPTLTLTYLNMAPASAAEVLQSLATEDAAAFLETVPTRLAAPVVNRMIPWSAARCLEQLTPNRAATILRHLVFNDSVSLARLVNPTHREHIFAELGGIFAKRLRNSLKYPLNQVGAWMDANIPMLRTNDTVRDALRLLSESPVTVSHIFLELDGSQKYAGVIAVRNLLRSDANTQLSQLEITYVQPVSNRATIASLAFDSRWDEFLFLPVTGRRATILGGLSRSTLRKATHQNKMQPASGTSSSVGQLFWAFAATATGILKLVVPPVRTPPPEITGGSQNAE